MMESQVLFSRTTPCRGRNGVANCKGLDLLETPDNTLLLTVIGIRGQSDSVMIDIPNEDIPTLIKTLKEYEGKPKTENLETGFRKIQVAVSVDVETRHSVEDTLAAIKRGIYRGLDSEPTSIAAPANVTINYCVER